MMTTPVMMRRARARRPFAVLAAAAPPPPSAGRNRENVEGEAMSFSQCVRRFGKPAAKKGSARTPRRGTPGGGGGVRRAAGAAVGPIGGAGEDQGQAVVSRRRWRGGGGVVGEEEDEDEDEDEDEEERGAAGGHGGAPGARRRPREVPGRHVREAPLALQRPGGAEQEEEEEEDAGGEEDGLLVAAAADSDSDDDESGRDRRVVPLHRLLLRGLLPHQRCRAQSICSSERSWSRKKIGVTIQRPFNLRTERRGKMKEESLVQRMKNKLLEEERLRNPVAQGLPWTTDVPENPVKPLGKEPTEPIDVVLHSEIRSVGRARFDHQVAERNSFLEKLNMERERQQKLDEELEIKQLRKEQVPRAHPMPDFSKPFVPKRYFVFIANPDRRVKGAEVFVGGLPRSVTERALREVFSPCGEIVDLRIMKDQNGISKLQGKRLAVDLSLDQDTLFFGNLCKDWGIEEFEELIRKVRPVAPCFEKNIRTFSAFIGHWGMLYQR
uniref:RRM domain-containing protein n=1 Tax=Oryza rufipogon TaxID=4529 RepID=A0A0E0RJ44_ORYRU